jgi:signal peptidase II
MMLPYAAFTAVLTVDQLTKHLVRSGMTLGESIPAEGFFRLVYVHNTGAAFGIFQDARPLLITIGIAAFAVIVWLIISRRIAFLNSPWGRLTLGLIAGGIMGNLIDRFYYGYVTDFLSAGIWPNFNIADSALVVGMTALAVLYLRSENHTDN